LQVFLMGITNAAASVVQQSTHTFRAVWPVIEGDGAVGTDAELILEALGDLPALARRHNAAIVGTPRACITEGNRVQGSAGHKRVIVVEAPAREVSRRAYHHSRGGTP
jgi:hypothetical protein